MKRYFIVLLALCGLSGLVPQAVQANDYMEHKENYNVYTSGPNKIRFVIPTWVLGAWYEHDYMSLPNSRITYQIDGQDEVLIANWVACAMLDNKEDNDKGSVSVRLQPNRGAIVVTSMHNGVLYTVPDNGNFTDWLTVSQRKAGGYDRVTFLEFDWYPPEELEEKEFSVRLYSEFGNVSEIIDLMFEYLQKDLYNPDDYFVIDPGYKKDWKYEGFHGRDPMTTPQLFSPYLYQMNEKGVAGYGYAAVPYSLSFEPIYYTTSLDTARQKTTDMAGNIFVPTNDTIQPDFYANFALWEDKEAQLVEKLKSTKVDINPYHRIYHFAAQEEVDSTGTYTGANLLSWDIKNPMLKDLVEGDYFEIVRSRDTTFANAQSIAVIAMKRDSTGLYSYRDDSRDTWTGNTNPDSLNYTLSYTADNYFLKDSQGKTRFIMTLNLRTDKAHVPSLPVYYRVRRASSSIWGWEHDFMQQDMVYKHNFLAPLDSVQPQYVKDADYERNHQVNFSIILKNDSVPTATPGKELFELTYSDAKMAFDSAFVYVDYDEDSHKKPQVTSDYVRVAVRDKDDNLLIDWMQIKKPVEISVPKNGKVSVRYLNNYDDLLSNVDYDTAHFELSGNSRLKFAFSQSPYFYLDSVSIDSYDSPSVKPEKYLTPELRQYLIDSLYNIVKAEYDSKPLGKCMWDKTARLVLIRTIKETGKSIESVIPADSIHRLANGDWQANFYDIADKACTHYSYAVRIDQSHADLHVMNPDVQLLPVALSGPDLYFDESADIVSFTATQGDAHSFLKQGVLLTWQPSSSAVDEYILSRVASGSSDTPDTLYYGLETNYMDATAVPDVHYEYTVSSHYNCNGKSTSQSATAEGWRTPYGEISGNILMPDNTGISGVKVDLLDLSDSTVIRSIVTDESGSFLFDSLLYYSASAAQTAVTSKDYSVIPTSEYAQFAFNNTDESTASITLSPDNARVDGINFENTNTTRLTGRALYDKTSVPVAGAMFKLNGDTIRRNGAPLTIGTDGNFELVLTLNQPYTLQIFKPGHTFVQDGYLEVEEGVDTFYLDKPLDGVRFYDLTKVRLVGRVAGGNDQRDLPEAFGVGKNNLGDDLQLVLQLEGDNIAHFVNDPGDPTRDTIQQVLDHIVFTNDSFAPTRVVGTTNTLIEKKRITIHPDPLTGEYEVDLWPVKYKVTQATARGYATLFADGAGNETFDLSRAPLMHVTDTLNGDTVRYNATYDRIYHNPVQVDLIQNIYGLERPAYGEPEMEVSGADPNKTTKIALYSVNHDNSVTYTLGYPVFYDNRKYQFKAKAYERYLYNNEESGKEDIVPQRGGTAIIRNGLHSATEVERYPLDDMGENSVIWLNVDIVDVEHAGTAPLRSVSVALETEGNVVETNVFSAFVTGSVLEEKSVRSGHGSIQLLDIIRDPGGSGSFAYVENGAEYAFSFAQKMKARIGVTLQPMWGQNVTQYIGVVTAPEGAGSYIGSAVETQKAFTFSIPISHLVDFGTCYSYNLKTNERIQTSSEANPACVGSAGDVFFGTTMANVIGTTKTISIIDDSLYRMCQPSLSAGTMLLLSQGTGVDGKPYYLVTGQKVFASAAMESTFAYSQYHILHTVIPRLAMDRQNLLMTFPDAEAAQAYADATGAPAYWYYETGDYLNDTIPIHSYTMFVPNDGQIYFDKVGELNTAITRWLELLYLNEREKVEARTRGSKIGMYSTSYGNTYSHSDEYSYCYSYNEYPQTLALQGEAITAGGTAVGTLIMQALQWKLMDWMDAPLNTSAMSAFLETYWTQGEATSAGGDDDWEEVSSNNQAKKVEEVAAKAGNMEFSMSFEPIKDMDSDKRMTTSATVKKAAGFTLVADDLGDITTSVYKMEHDSAWAAQSDAALEAVDQKGNEALLYGSYVFYTEGGSTFCPHEDAEVTRFYNPGTSLGNSTEWVAKPELTADVYEIANVDPDKYATFRLTLFNQGQMDAGMAEEGMGFYLFLDSRSNPDGASVFVNGAAIAQGIYYWLEPNTPVTQTIEVARGTVDDYNLTFYLYTENCGRTSASLSLGVHFLPLSTDVNLSSPRQNWVMNTLSPRDSVGYYLPVTIDGFDLHHKNFDHIEFQYKLVSESDEKWVNQCSFYANDSLYNLASGNKAMIQNGKIAPFRFYGERDPMEQRYDLRAVSFCRYGSGYVHKASPVLTGIKDTRPPRVFGRPEPANSILSVDKNLSLRFSEAIAGNYLDEDNNFRIVGVTNETGITASSALQFDGTNNSYAYTKVNRNLADYPISVDMMVKPTEEYRDEVFFTHGEAGKGLVFGKTADNRLYVQVGNSASIYSKKLTDPMLAFTRVVFTYDAASGVRFYVGTEDITDPSETKKLTDYSSSAPLIFGRGFSGEMLETRVWTKALTEEEVSATYDRYLSGYERELLAYYRMNEGKGDYVDDYAHGATLYLNSCTWNKKVGYSLYLNNETAKLDGNILGRSAAYDATLMFWFRTAADGTLFSANRTEPTDSTDGKGTRIAIEQGKLMLYNDNKSWKTGSSVADDTWHHFVLTINRTFDNVALYLDGALIKSYAAVQMSGITGAMYLGGDGFVGHIDEFAAFEQSMPRTLIESSDDMAFVGDEMGLIGYLPFEEQYLNPSGVLAQRFSPNDQRQYKDQNGNIIDKVVPLIISQVTEQMQDNTQNAPVNDHGQLTKLHFDWAFNDDELMINILNQDYEINKQSIYITIRDVEDLNGNPMVSPMTWVAFVDRNPLKWSSKQLTIDVDYDVNASYQEQVRIINNSGIRHTYTIESLPQWLDVDQTYGTIDPQGEQTVILAINRQMPVGVYSDVIYLVDENGLAEPLMIDYNVIATCPWEKPDENMYPMSMSICGQVMLDGALDSDEDDRVIALYQNKCIGMANVDFNADRNTSKVFITVFGDESMNNRVIDFQLWQASTGTVYNLVPDTSIVFTHSAVYGCGTDDPVVFSVNGSESQNIAVRAGWNWISTNLYLTAGKSQIKNVLAAAVPWTEGDNIKTPANRQFCTYSAADNAFVGSLTDLDYRQMYMVYVANDNTLRINGDILPDTAMSLTLRGDGQWTAFPCLFDKAMPIDDAMADYYDYASPGDLVKSHSSFAVFSPDKYWEGDLTALRPGEGYLFRRLGSGAVTINFYNKNASESTAQAPAFRGSSATNMTIIAHVDGEGLRAYIDNTLVGVATQVDSLYFLTISSDNGGQLRFETSDGTPLVSRQPIMYSADSHHGSLLEPVSLTPCESDRPYKVIENDHVIIIRNSERYDVTGIKLK